MTILQIEHMVTDFKKWKKVFDDDSDIRKQNGVKSYSIYRFKDNPDYVIIDLVFENNQDAENIMRALHSLWERADGSVMINPKTRVLNLVESKET
jgi:23S rRNA A2030 N6-methylase RlmJ